MMVMTIMTLMIVTLWSSNDGNDYHDVDDDIATVMMTLLFLSLLSCFYNILSRGRRRTYTDFSNIDKKITASAEFIVMLFTPVTSSVKLSLKEIVIVIYFVCACVCPHFQ